MVARVSLGKRSAPSGRPRQAWPGGNSFCDDVLRRVAVEIFQIRLRNFARALAVDILVDEGTGGSALIEDGGTTISNWSARAR